MWRYWKYKKHGFFPKQLRWSAEKSLTDYCNFIDVDAFTNHTGQFSFSQFQIFPGNVTSVFQLQSSLSLTILQCHAPVSLTVTNESNTNLPPITTNAT